MHCQQLFVDMNRASEQPAAALELVQQFLTFIKQSSGGLFGAGKAYLDKRPHSS